MKMIKNETKKNKKKNNNNILIVKISQILIKLQNNICNVHTLYKICYEKKKRRALNKKTKYK